MIVPRSGLRPGSCRAALGATVVAAVTGGLLSATTTVADAATICSTNVFQRTFFANTSFSGTPKKTDCDSTIDQNWGSGAPASGLPTNNFGVRWTVTRDFGSGGPFSFAASGYDGIRVYLDSSRKIDLWSNTGSSQAKTVNVTVPKGKHTLRVDYVNWTGTAKVKFGYPPRTSATYDKVVPLTPAWPRVSYSDSTRKTTVSWAKNLEMDLAGYRVYRRAASSTTWENISGDITATAYTDAPPADGRQYFYRVRAIDKAANRSAATAEQGITTYDSTTPAAPTGLTAHGDLYGMKLAWQPVTGAVAYEVYEKSATSGEYTKLGVGRVTKTSYTHAIAAGTTRRTYAVRAFDATGKASGYSATATSDSIDRTAPDAPQKLYTTVGADQVALYWQTPETPMDVELANDARFTVYRSVGSTLGADRVRVDCENESTTLHSAGGYYAFTCYDPSIALDTTYTYGVTVTDGEGNESALSNLVTVATAERVPPRPLTGLTATPRADGVLLRWDEPVDDDIVAYHGRRGVRQDDGSVTWLAELATCVDGPDDPLAMLCIGVPDGETNVFTVTAEDTWGNELPVTAAGVPQATATELDLKPAEAGGSDPGPIHGGGGWRASEDTSGAYWSCQPKTACADLTEFRVSRWNAAQGTYEEIGSTPAVAGQISYAFMDETQPLGATSFYRIVGVRADGTTTAAGHAWCVRPDMA